MANAEAGTHLPKLRWNCHRARSRSGISSRSPGTPGTFGNPLLCGGPDANIVVLEGGPLSGSRVWGGCARNSLEPAAVSRVGWMSRFYSKRISPFQKTASIHGPQASSLTSRLPRRLFSQASL